MSPNPDEINILRELFSTARNVTGNFPIVVFTHKTRGNVSEKERILKDLGVERVFAFENYTPADHIKTRGRHEDVLRFLLEVIKDVNFCVAQQRDPDREMMERKQLVYGYIKQRELNQNRKQSGVPDKRDHPQYNHREETQDKRRAHGHGSGNGHRSGNGHGSGNGPGSGIGHGSGNGHGSGIGHEQQPDYQNVTPEKPRKKPKGCCTII